MLSAAEQRDLKRSAAVIRPGVVSCALAPLEDVNRLLITDPSIRNLPSYPADPPNETTSYEPINQSSLIRCFSLVSKSTNIGISGECAKDYNNLLRLSRACSRKLQSIRLPDRIMVSRVFSRFSKAGGCIVAALTSGALSSTGYWCLKPSLQKTTTSLQDDSSPAPLELAPDDVKPTPEQLADLARRQRERELDQAQLGGEASDEDDGDDDDDDEEMEEVEV